MTSRDKPIPMRAHEVRALLDGRKTQHREILKLPKKTFSGGPIYERPDMGGWEPTTSGGGGCFTIGRAGERIPAPEQIAIWHRTTGVCMAAPVQIGDRIWVREAIERANGEAVGYPADGTWLPNTPWIWKRSKLPSIHMPRWASRLTLIVADVRVQRLQEISEEDAIAEGVCAFAETLDRAGAWDGLTSDERAAVVCAFYGSNRRMFEVLWDTVNGPGAWERNDWVAAYTFTVHHCNIDALPDPLPLEREDERR